MAGVLRCEALETLCTTAGVGVGRPRRLVPLLAAVLGAERERRRVLQAPVDRLGDIAVDQILGVLQSAIIEARRAGGAKSVVQRVLGMEVDVVVAVVVADIPVPAAIDAALEAGNQRAILREHGDFRHVAVRIELRDQRALAAVVARAVKRIGDDVAVAGRRGRVGAQIVGECEACVGRDAARVHLRVAVDVSHFPEPGVVALIRARAGIERLERAGTIGRVLLAQLAGHVDKTAVLGEARTGVAGNLELGTVTGRVAADINRQAAAGLAALEHDVHHTGNGIRTVLRRGAVTQHLDPCDGANRDGIEIHRRGTATDAAIHVEQRGYVAALAVDEDQHLVRGEAAQLGGADRARAVGHRRAGEVQGRQSASQRSGQLGRAGGLQGLRRNDIDRRLRLGNRAIGDPGAGHDDLVQGGRVSGGGRGLGESNRCSDGQCDGQGEAAGCHGECFPGCAVATALPQLTQF